MLNTAYVTTLVLKFGDHYLYGVKYKNLINYYYYFYYYYYYYYYCYHY
jgi:hypothetical protein